MLKAGKLHGLLLIHVVTPEEVNTSVLQGLIHDYELKNYERLLSECIITLFFGCSLYGHIAMTYWRLHKSGNCTKELPSAACQTAKDPCTHNCSNCKGKHQAWDRACLVRKAEAERAAAAYTTHLTLYKVTSNAFVAAQSPSIHFHSPSHPTPFTAIQGQQHPLPQIICKWAGQSSAPAAGEQAEDSSIAAPQQVSPMEGISPAPPSLLAHHLLLNGHCSLLSPLAFCHPHLHKHISELKA